MFQSTPIFAKSKIRISDIFKLFCLACSLLSSSRVQGQDNRVDLTVRDGKILYYRNTMQPGSNDMPSNGEKLSTTIPQKLQPRISGITSTIILNLKAEDAGCGQSNGAVIASASGGSAPYRYTLVNTGSTLIHGNFRRLNAGTYTVSVTDANGETATGSVTVINTLPRPAISLVSTKKASACISVTLLSPFRVPEEFPLISIAWI